MQQTTQRYDARLQASQELIVRLAALLNMHRDTYADGAGREQVAELAHVEDRLRGVVDYLESDHYLVGR